MECYGIHKDCPIIWQDDCDHFRDKGWRWERNLRVGYRHTNIHTIRSYQRRYGVENITIGNPWTWIFGEPFVSVDLIGLYIRDINVENLVSELYRWMDSWGK